MESLNNTTEVVKLADQLGFSGTGLLNIIIQQAKSALHQIY